MTDGYLYCFSNKSMPGLLKVGMTQQTPNTQLLEASKPDTWRPPSPYTIEIAKYVKDVKQKEETLHKLLSQYTERPNPDREFFYVSIEDIKTFFDLIDGKVWINDDNKQNDDKKEEQYEFKAYRGCRY